MGYRRLAPRDRYQIEGFLKSGLGINQIAKALNVSGSTISREIKKSLHSYDAERAQRETNRRIRSRYVARIKIKGVLRGRIESKLKLDWSPEQIAGRLNLEQKASVSHQSIYRFIVRDRLSGGELYKHLRILRRQRKARTAINWKPGCNSIKDRIFIKDRPKHIEHRSRFGDFERDTVFGKFNGPLLLTIVDRKSRLLRLAWIRRKSAQLVHRATARALQYDTVHTITNDNGPEFARHKETASELGAKIYFSHAYRAWERGTNENLNGLLRQYFPRKKSIGYLSRMEVAKIERRLNSRPRKVLGFRTPLEIHNST